MSKKLLFFFLSMTMSFSFEYAAPLISYAAEDLSSRAARGAALAERNLGLQTEPPAEIENVRAQDFSPKIRWTPSFGWGKYLLYFSRILLFCAITAIVLIVLFNLKNNLWSFSRGKKLVFKSGEKERGADAVSRMEHAQTEADEFARGGGFAEAIHILLLQSVGEMRKRMPNPIAASLTSRELLRLLDLSPEEREVFGTLVESVEISHFGGYEPGEDEYLACRRSFDALTDLLRRYSYG
jgi:hypothetical protein